MTARYTIFLMTKRSVSFAARMQRPTHPLHQVQAITHLVQTLAVEVVIVDEACDGRWVKYPLSYEKLGTIELLAHHVEVLVVLLDVPLGDGDRAKVGTGIIADNLRGIFHRQADLILVRREG